MLQQTIAVFLVLGLLLGSLWLLKRTGAASLNILFPRPGKRTTHNRLKVIERVVLTPQHSLHLVSIDDSVMLFCASPNGCLAVSESAVLGKTDRGGRPAASSSSDPAISEAAAC